MDLNFLPFVRQARFSDLPLKEKALPIFLAKIYRKSFIKNCYVIHSPSCIVRTQSQVFEKTLSHTEDLSTPHHEWNSNRIFISHKGFNRGCPILIILNAK